MLKVLSTYEHVSEAMRAAPFVELRSLLAEESDAEIAAELEGSWPADAERPALANIANAVAQVRREIGVASTANVASILNSGQAEAVYSAMCHLNNVSGLLNAAFSGITVVEYSNGVVLVVKGDNREEFASQSAFATAYSLQQG